MLNAAASATTGPMRASCGSRSQFAVLFACQMPLMFGVPSGVRGARNACSCPAPTTKPSHPADTTAANAKAGETTSIITGPFGLGFSFGSLPSRGAPVPTSP